MRVQKCSDAFRTLTKTKKLGKNHRTDVIDESSHRPLRLTEEVPGVALQEKKTHQAGQVFTDNQIANLTGFFDVLKRIHIRLAIEGYTITPEDIEAPTTRFVGV